MKFDIFDTLAVPNNVGVRKVKYYISSKGRKGNDTLLVLYPNIVYYNLNIIIIKYIVYYNLNIIFNNKSNKRCIS